MTSFLFSLCFQTVEGRGRKDLKLILTFGETLKLRGVWRCARPVLESWHGTAASWGHLNKPRRGGSQNCTLRWTHKNRVPMKRGFCLFSGQVEFHGFFMFFCNHPTTLPQSGARRLADVGHGAQKRSWDLACWWVLGNRCCWLHHADGQRSRTVYWPPASGLVAMIAL